MDVGGWTVVVYTVLVPTTFERDRVVANIDRRVLDAHIVRRVYTKESTKRGYLIYN